jgi:hypothetical protein
MDSTPFPPVARRAQRSAPASAFSLISALVVLPLVLIDAELLDRVPAICTFKNLFGIECWACGLTRAFSALLRGDLAAALAHNRAVVPAAVGVSVTVFREIAGLWRQTGPKPEEAVYGDDDRRGLGCDRQST